MITLLKFYSEINEDSYDEGEGRHTGCGYPVTHLAEQFPNIESAIKWFGGRYGYSENSADYEVNDTGRVMYTSRMCADHSDQQNGGWFDPTKEETEAWEKGNGKLYVENVYLIFSET